jgi:hypothetical protein
MNSVTLRVSGSREAYINAMAYFFAMTPNITDFGITGYPTMTLSSYMGTLTAPGKTTAQIQSFVNPIATRMRSYGASVSLSGGMAKGLYKDNGEFDIPDALSEYYRQKNSLSLLRRQRLDFKPMHQTPVNDMASRLLARSALNEANLPAIKRMLSGMTGNLLPYGNTGGAVTRSRNLDVGLNPAWRDSVMHLIAINYNMRGNIAAMDPLSANHAAYWNEANDHEVDWKTTFWGPKAHYDKLLAIKTKYDPSNTLWCFPCVGADVFVMQQGKLYLAGK